MVCIYCGSKTQVTNSRASGVSKQVWRRRHCSSCGATFTTFELPDLYNSLVIERESGKLAPFSKNNLFVSLYDSCRHRVNPIDDAAALTDTIITKLLKSSANGTIKRSELVNIASKALKNFDNAAAVYYRAYHQA